MRLRGDLISRRRYEALIDTEKTDVDRRKILRLVKKAATGLDYYVKYHHRNQEPYVYVKYAAQSRDRTNYAYIFVRNTTQDNLKKVIVRNHGFDKESLEILAATILLNLGISFNNSRLTPSESQPCQNEQLGLLLPER